MPDTDTTTDAPTDAPADQTDTSDTDTTDWKAEAEKWKTQARKHEERSKQNQGALKQLEDQRKQSMTEAERAIEEAKATARAEAMREFGGRLVDAEFRALAAGRLSDEAVGALVAHLDRSRFLDDEGEPDRKAIGTFLDGIAAKTADTTAGQPVLLDLGQGARGGEALALNGDPLTQMITQRLTR